MRLPPAHPLLSSCSGAAALEFAIVSVPFFGLLIGMASVTLNLYLQFALDYALQQAVRQIQLGLVPATTTAADFTGNTFCPIYQVFAPCTGILVSVQPVADYTAPVITTAASPVTFCTGVPGQLMYARAVYQAPVLSSIYSTAATIVGPGTSGSLIVSAAAFANENPSGASITGASGC